MNKNFSDNSRFKGLRIAITGANGSLGKFLIKEFKKKGAYVVGLTHTKNSNDKSYEVAPDDWLVWSCGEEKLLSNRLANIDILILNHGFNPKEDIDSNAISKAIEINSLSHWKLIQIFEELTLNKINLKNNHPKEIWVNTSEAEIQPALSPTYEISKRLIGQLVSLKMKELNIKNNSSLIVKKLVLGPFKSELNPIGIMNADLVAKKILNLGNSKKNLIIVSPNPLTYFLMPLIEFFRLIYFKITENLNKF